MKKQITIGSDNPFLRDHHVHGHAILPGLAYIDIAYQFFRDYGRRLETLQLEKLLIFKPLVAEEGRPVRLEIAAMTKAAGHWSLRFEGVTGPGEAVTYASAEVRERASLRFDARLDRDTATAQKDLTLDAIYRRLGARGLVHSGVMKVDGSVYAAAGAGIIQLALPSALPVPPDAFLFHPALIDGAAIAALAFLEKTGVAEQSRGDLWLPLAYAEFQATEPLRGPCHAQVALERVRVQGDILAFDLDFFKEGGNQIAALRQLTLKRVGDAGLLDQAGQATVKPRAQTGRSLKTPSHTVSALDVVTEAVVAVLGGGPEAIDGQAEFYDLGLQSAGLLQVVSLLEERLGQSLSPTLLFEYTNLAALAEHLQDAHGGSFASQAGGSVEEVRQHPPERYPGDEHEDIAIIGMAGRFPGAADLQAFWANLKAGVHSVTTVPENRWDWRAFESLRSASGRPLSKWGGFLDHVDCFDAPFFRIAPGEAEAMDPQERLFLETCWEAIEDAGYTPEPLAPLAGHGQRRAVGVFVGVMHNDYGFIAAEANRAGQPQPISLSLAPIANRVSYAFDFHGPSLAVDTVCSASLTALHLALESLRKGESQVALAGGVNLSLHPNKYLSYGREDMHASDDACRSFGEGGDGYVSAEGVGTVVLKPLSRARTDGDHIHAVIKASTINHGGKANGMHVPNPVAQADVVHQCLTRAGINPRSITYLEAHGTGTSLGDPIEIQGLSKAFSRSTLARQFCAIGSVKSNIGHAESAAGISGLMKVVLQLQHRMLVPSLHSDPVNPYLDLGTSPFYIQQEAGPWESEQGHPRRAGVSAFGATGSNAHVILEEYRQPQREDRPVLQGPVMIVLSARNGERLKAVAGRLSDHLKAMPTPLDAGEGQRFLADLSYTLQEGRRALSERLAFEAESIPDILAMLRAFLDGKHPPRPLHRGRVDPGQPVRPFDPSLAETFANGEHPGQQAHLLDSWVKGAVVDWPRLVWAEEKPCRISLPTYPFARERYWIGGTKMGGEPRPVLSASVKADGLSQAVMTADDSLLVQVVRRMVAADMKIDPVHVSVEEGLFDQGLSSAGVVSLFEGLARRLRVTLSPALLFEHSSIAALCDYLLQTYPGQCADVGHEVSTPPAVLQSPGHISQSFALTEAQKGLWALQKRLPGMSAYNVPLCFRVSGVDLPALETACDFLLRQYPVLTAVIEASGMMLHGVTRPAMHLSLRRRSLNGLTQSQQQAAVRRVAQEPFDLDRGPLFKVFLFDLGADESLLFLNVHHIIFDGHSIPLLMDTLLKAYDAHRAGGVVQPVPLSLPYGAFADQEAALVSSEEGARRLAYWQEKLAGPVPVLALPGAPSVPQANLSAIEACQAESRKHVLPRDLTQRIKAFCEARRLYPSTFLLGLFKLVLARHSGEEQVMVGMPGSQRRPDRFQDAVDFLINMLPMLSRVDEAEALPDFLDRLQHTMLEAMLNDYPFPVLARSLAQSDTAASVAPFFQAVFMFQDMLGAMHRLEPDFRWVDDIRQEGEYPLVLEVLEEQGQFVLFWTFQTARHDAEMIRLMAAQYAELAQAVLSAPDLPLSAHSMLTSEEQQQLLGAWNATAQPYPHQQTVDDLFRAQVEAMPHAIALVCGDQTLSYAALSARVDAIAARLQAEGGRPGARVALSVERSLDMVAGLLAILRAGMTYVPLDPSFPEDRLATILADSEAAIVLTQTALDGKVRRLIDQRRGHRLSQVAVLALDRIEASGISALAAASPAPDALAYLIYTSGSTGKPKGVMIPHRALTNFLTSMAKAPGMGRGERLLAVTTYSFDIAGLELFLPLIVGGTCHIAGTETVQNAEKLKDLIRQTRPTLMQATPSTWSMLFHAGWRNEERIKILCGGEALPEALRQRFLETESELWNLFGPTETTIWSTLKRLSPHEATTIGGPIANTEILVLDDQNRLTPVGIAGELCIAGDGLSAGYWNLPELTAEKFIDHPCKPGQKLYRTGDLARWTARGEIDYLGRLDFQVKLNGFRIELGEIEKHLTDPPALREALVVLQARGDISRLVAFLVLQAGAPAAPSAEDLKSFLRERLPAYMIPAFFVEVAALPLTPNGKIDRRDLMAREVSLSPACSAAAPAPKSPPVTKQALEETLLEVWTSVFGLQGIRRDHSFVDLGGNSVSATFLAERIAKRLNCAFSVTDLFRYPSIAKISAYLGEVLQAWAVEPDAAPPAPAPSQADPETSEDALADSLAIIGISCHFPGAKDHRQFWQNLVAGRESVRFLHPDDLADAGNERAWRDHPDYVPVALNLEGKMGFDPDFFKLSRGNALLMDPQFRQLLMHAWKAVEDAGYRPEDVPKTGVFMSASNNFYQSLARRALQHAEVMEQAEDYVAWILAQGGSIPTMVSYQLGLTGPSVFVHTNCSSSLSGLYFAQQALASGDADCALVGAATLFSSFEAGYIHQPGLNFASDGHCKTFDARADGMIAGEGTCVIMVKRARDAIRDRDNIYCLIRGIAINNDGDDKAGFYAPSIAGQSAVIRRALEKTGINPETIRYVEAHGTGTALGDPIEVSALSEVYESLTGERQFCGIGSVKPNIGHLDTAAGLAGCVKLAMSLRHRCLPAEINYTTPNPRVDFASSPFFVQERESRWDEQAPLVRAALSSFGIGGSNAHAIFEEYRSPLLPELDDAMPRAVLVPLSARNPDRLRVYAGNLLTFLKDHSVSLADLAYTMQVGRRAMDSRVAFVVESLEALGEALSRFLKGEEDAGRFEGVVPTGRADADEETSDLTALWLGKGKLAPLAKAWSNGQTIDWTKLVRKERCRRLSLPTYPFAEEPFHHRQTRALSAKAGQMPLHPLVHSRSGVGFSSRFDGTEFFLSEHVLKGRKVLPGVAYLEMTRFAGESALGRTVTALHDVVWMQPVIVDDARRSVAIKLDSGADQVRFEVLSEDPNAATTVHSQGYVVTASANEAAEPSRIELDGIRARCRDSVSSTHFYGVLRDLGADYGQSFQVIEALWKTDGEALARFSLPDHRLPDAGSYALHPAIMDAAFQITDSLILQPEEKGGFLPFFVKRVEIARATPQRGFVHVRFSRGEKPSGPVVRYDIDIIDEYGALCVAIREFSARKLAKADFGPAEADIISAPMDDLLYLTRHWVERPVRPEAEAAGRKRLIVLAGLEQDHAALSAVPADWQVIHLPILPQPEESVLSTFTTCFSLVQKLFRERQAANNDLVVLTPEGGEAYVFQPLEGLFLTAMREARKFKARLVGVEGLENLTSEALLSLLTEEMRDGSSEAYVRYTKDLKRLVKRSAEITLPLAEPAAMLLEGGVYWITGGSGRLARRLAEDKARRQRVHVVLTGRTAPDRQNAAQTTFENGSCITYWQADVTSRSDMQQVVERIGRDLGSLKGIVHAAGLLRDTLIVNKTVHDIEEVFAPKALGLLILDEITRHEPLDFMVLFASVSGTFGVIGQADYAGANGLLDAFAEHRNRLVAEGRRQGRTLAIDWPLWRAGGMQVSAEQQAARFQASGASALETETGLHAFYRALGGRESQIIVLAGDRAKLRESYVNPEEQPSATPTVTAPETRSVGVRKALRHHLRVLAGEQVHRKPEELDDQVPFGDYGFDSISFTTFSNRLNVLLKLKAARAEAIAPTVFFEHNTLTSLETYLLADYRDVVVAAFASEDEGGDQRERSAPVADLPPPVLAPAVEAEAQGCDDIAIIGMSGKFPMADDLDAFWRNLTEGRDCITEVPAERWKWRAIYGDPLTETNRTDRKWGGFIRGAAEFDPLFFGISPKDAETLDPCHRLLMMHAWMAMEDAGYSSSALSGSRTAVFVGIGNSGYGDVIARSGLEVEGQTVIATVSSMAPARVSHFLNLRGPSEPVDTACSSSLVAIHRGIQAIRNGEADLALVGGVQGMFSPQVQLSFSKAGMLAADGRGKTFSSKADGYVRGEGVGILLLKPLSKAVRDRDNIHGVIRSSAINHGGRGNTLTSPNPKAQKELLVTALSDAGIHPGSIGYIETHGTGTALGDPIEISGLKDAFDSLRTDSLSAGACGLGSVKTNIGHLELAAGVAGVIKVLLQIRHRTLVPTLHCEEMNPLIKLEDSPFRVVRSLEPWRPVLDDSGWQYPLRAGVSSFGFGGVNAHVVIEEYLPEAHEVSADEDGPGPVMIVLSARFPDRLKAYAEARLAFAERQEEAGEAGPTWLRRLAFTLQDGRDQMKHRLGFVVSCVEELKARLRAVLTDNEGVAGRHRGEAARQPDGDDGVDKAEDLLRLHAQGDHDAILAEWVRGRRINWRIFQAGSPPRKLSAPTYPFAREVYWVKRQQSDSKADSRTLEQLLGSRAGPREAPDPSRSKASGPPDPAKRRELEKLLDALGASDSIEPKRGNLLSEEFDALGQR
ncbi:non-ribosomal peptide synthetase [Agrobacterium vitis]|uniref:non-ribosomal peptide synthetase n=1 Tax=Agrobacterium vitis TaxID=373 RepID=UPI002034B17B|nr:non-ribosomal peptide synthetase [Agrobacterium vitis]MCM2451867.1 amino acid adenylation domain-containing protein [Agrobacterium vitis]